MILSENIIEDLKKKSNLPFDCAKDFERLAYEIREVTGRSIGVTTLKRLMGYINDDRKTNTYTLNTIASFLGYESWNLYIQTLCMESVWDYKDSTYYVDELCQGDRITLKYLDRIVNVVVKMVGNKNVLCVMSSINCSLRKDDILYVDAIIEGQPLTARCVVRGCKKGNYKTRGEIKSISLNSNE